MSSTTHDTNLTIDTASCSTLLFDMDGTMIDNMTIHHETWRELLHTLGHEWSLAEVKQRVWGKNEEIFERLFPGQYSHEEKQSLATQKESWYIERYRPHIVMLPGLETLLRNARNAGLKTAIVTAAPRMNVEFAYEELKLSRFFDTVVHSDEVTFGKPNPESYLLAAKRLAVDVRECLVFEDAPVGVQAAHAAGMDAYVILTTHQRDEFSQFPNVRAFVDDFSNFTIGRDSAT
ncbi:MAG: HAD family hydrolase [Pseudomonadota bacterium]|jgi:beta-phosphoglucomutase